MSSLVIKLGSLVIKTLSKPIANKIKEQARQHERFRRICVRTAQAIHRWDMRFKLGLLQDSAAIERQTAREAAEAQARKHKHEAPTVKTEAQTKADEAAAAKDKDKGKEKAKEAPKPKIRPLSEAKAIDSGANFVSETFLLLVGVALILGENWRQTRKAANRREDISERLAELEDYEKSARRGMVELEKEVIRLRAKENSKGTVGHHQPRILPEQIWQLEEKEEAEEKPAEQGWWSWLKATTIGGGSRKEEQESSSKAPSDREGKSENNGLAEANNEVHETPKHSHSTILNKILPSRISTDEDKATPSTTPDARDNKEPQRSAHESHPKR